MSTRTHYKIRSKETWDLIRAAYLGGDTARAVAARYDVSISAVERRASRERWTKRAYAQARSAVSNPPPETGRDGSEAQPDPVLTFPLAMAGAEAALRAGRGAEALRLMQAAEHYLKMRQRLEDVDRQRALEQAQLSPEVMWRHIADKAMSIAGAMVTRGDGPYFLSRKIYAWRARHLGPQAAAEDYKRAVDGNWRRDYWNDDGTLKDTEGLGWTDEELEAFRR